MADIRFPTDTPLKAVPKDADNLLLADSQNSFQAKYTTVDEVLDTVDISGKADKTNVLELDNTTTFTPNADYEPATKKYVDDNSGVDPTLRQDIDINTGDIITNTDNITDNVTDINTNTYDIGLNTAHRNNIIDPHEGAVLIDVEMKTYKETIATPSSSSGVLTLDYSIANTFYVTLTEDITSIVLTNAPTSGKVGSLTLTIQQDASTAWTVDFSSINWPDNVTPDISSVLGAVDTFSLVTYTAGAVIYGFVSGQDYGV